jgi:hypothetical protein
VGKLIRFTQHDDASRYRDRIDIDADEVQSIEPYDRSRCCRVVAKNGHVYLLLDAPETVRFLVKHARGEDPES